MDDYDWEPITERVAQHRPAPSGFTTSSHAAQAPGTRPAVSSGRPPLRVPPLAGTLGRRTSGAGLLRSPLASVSNVSNAAGASPHAVVGARLPPPRGQPAPQPQKAPTSQKMQQPAPARHRTMLNYALDVFTSRLAPWTQQSQHVSLDPDGHLAGTAGGQHFTAAEDASGELLSLLAPSAARAPDASTAPLAARMAGGPAAALSTDALEQLESILFALQTSLRDGRADVTAKDREDLWRLCSVCWEAASAAARVGDSVAGAAEQSRVLQGLGGTLYDLANEQPSLAAPGGRTAGSGGGDIGGGCSHGSLFGRVKFFYRMGRMWLAIGNHEQAGWHLARAREGLGQLQADEPLSGSLACASPSAAATSSHSRQRPTTRPGKRTWEDVCSQGGQDEEEGMGAQEEVAEGGGVEGGAGGAGRGAGGGGGRGVGGPWLGLGVSAAAYLGVEAGVLLESLRLALAEGHKALGANLRTQLRRIVRSHHTPPDLAAAATLATAAALTDAAASKLQLSRQRGAAAPVEDAGVPAGSQPPRVPAPPQQYRQDTAAREGLELLVSARVFLEEALEEAQGQGQAVDEGDGDGQHAGQKERRLSDGQLAGLEDMRQQVLKLLISGSLRTGAFEAALTYSREFTAPRLSPASEAVAPPTEEGHGQARRPQQGPPLDVLLLALQAYVGLGRVAEAAAVVARDIQPHAACTPSVIKTALSRLLDAPLPQLSAAMPHVTACLLACLARCGRDDSRGGGAGTGGSASWPASAGAELVLLVATAVASHEGPVAERHLLTLLAHDDAVAAVCQSTDPRDRLHRLLYARAAAAYQQRDHAAAARLFAAALLYASGGGGAPYCRTARMLSNCYAALGQARRALGYLDLAEAHEPDTVAQLLLRLRLLLMVQEGEGSEGGGRSGAGVGAGGAGDGAGDGEEDADAAAAVSARAAVAAARNDEEAVRLVERLPRCCDFEASHLTVAHDIALRARRFTVALAATQLAMRDLVARRPAPGSLAAAAVLQTAVALTQSSVTARLAAAADSGNGGGSRSGGRCSSNTKSASKCGPMLCDIAQGVLQDLRWLCTRLKAVGGEASRLPAQAQAALAWLRDVALRLSHDALGACEPSLDGDARGDEVRNGDVFGSQGGSQQPLRAANPAVPVRATPKRRPGRGASGSGGWRMAAVALGVARQLDAALRPAGAAAAGTADGAGGASEQRRAARDPMLQPAMIAVAAHMLSAYAQGEAGGTALLDSADKLLNDPQLLLQQPTEPSGAQPTCAQQKQGPGRPGCQGPLIEAGLMRSSVLQLRFASATFHRDGQRQKATLQALVQDPDVSGPQLEALAELCLAPGSPWRCAAMACGLLGFALRKALTAAAAAATAAAPTGPTSQAAPDASAAGPAGRREAVSAAAGREESADTDGGIALVARAVRRLFLLGSPDVRLRVCERAAEVTAQMHQRLPCQAALNGPALNSKAPALMARYPEHELHYLWASCYNGAVADALEDSVQTGGRARRLLAMATRLAGLSQAYGSGAVPDAVADPQAAFASAREDGVRLERLACRLEQAYAAALALQGCDHAAQPVPQPPQPQQRPFPPAQPHSASQGAPVAPARDTAGNRLSQDQRLPAQLTLRVPPYSPAPAQLPSQPPGMPPQAPKATAAATAGALPQAEPVAALPAAAVPKPTGDGTAALAGPVAVVEGAAQPAPPKPPRPPQTRGSPAIPRPLHAAARTNVMPSGCEATRGGAAGATARQESSTPRRLPTIRQRQRTTTPSAGTPVVSSSQPQPPKPSPAQQLPQESGADVAAPTAADAPPLPNTGAAAEAAAAAPASAVSEKARAPLAEVHTANMPCSSAEDAQQRCCAEAAPVAAAAKLTAATLPAVAAPAPVDVACIHAGDTLATGAEATGVAEDLQEVSNAPKSQSPTCGSLETVCPAEAPEAGSGDGSNDEGASLPCDYGGQCEPTGSQEAGCDDNGELVSFPCPDEEQPRSTQAPLPPEGGGSCGQAARMSPRVTAVGDCRATHLPAEALGQGRAAERQQLASVDKQEQQADRTPLRQRSQAADIDQLDGDAPRPSPSQASQPEAEAAAETAVAARLQHGEAAMDAELETDETQPPDYEAAVKEKVQEPKANEGVEAVAAVEGSPGSEPVHDEPEDGGSSPDQMDSPLAEQPSPRWHDSLCGATQLPAEGGSQLVAEFGEAASGAAAAQAAAPLRRPMPPAELHPPEPALSYLPVNRAAAEAAPQPTHGSQQAPPAASEPACSLEAAVVKGPVVEELEDSQRPTCSPAPSSEGIGPLSQPVGSASQSPQDDRVWSIEQARTLGGNCEPPIYPKDGSPIAPGLAAAPIPAASQGSAGAMPEAAIVGAAATGTAPAPLGAASVPSQSPKRSREEPNACAEAKCRAMQRPAKRSRPSPQKTQQAPGPAVAPITACIAEAALPLVSGAAGGADGVGEAPLLHEADEEGIAPEPFVHDGTVAEPCATDVGGIEGTAANACVGVAILVGSEYADEVDALMLDDW